MTSMAEKQKILIVDDDANIAELIELYLTKECFQCMQAHDGEEALKKNASFQPDLILLDIMLPGIDGYDVCREIRKTSTVPIIMLSAKGEVFDKVLGLELGADDYIIKPFDSKELVARVKAVLRRYQTGSAPAAPAASTETGTETIQYRSHRQFVKLFCRIYGTSGRDATKRTGAFVFSRHTSKPGIYKRTAS